MSRRRTQDVVGMGRSLLYLNKRAILIRYIKKTIHYLGITMKQLSAYFPVYEKIVDGRCGRLRTRIVRVDTKTKVHREELKKSEYSIINTGPKAVVELAGANIK